MTDPTPNDLSHLSDEEFNALCPQGFHGTGDFEPDNLTPAEHERLLLMSEHGIATTLSPAAQAVLDAAVLPCTIRQGIAAALRAASDRMMDLVGDICHPKYMEGIEVSSDFLDHIATELEGHQ
jgi:hypothetical protein